MIDRVASHVPDEADMEAEITNDRGHERFLFRAALIAAIAVALVVSLRVVLG